MGKTIETPEIIYDNGRTWAPHLKISIFAIILKGILLPIYWIVKASSFVAEKMFKPVETETHRYSENM